MLLAAFAALAWAGVPEDLLTASNKDLPTNLRREAMDRLEQSGVYDEVVSAARNSELPADRRWVAVRSLGKNPHDGAREVLLELLGSPDAPVRMAACASLAEREDVTVTGRVAARLTDPALLVRVAAADALAKMKQPSAIPDLGRALADPTNYAHSTSLWVRRHFVDAIVAIGTDEAVPALARVLDDADPNVSTAALRGLETVTGVSFAAGRTPPEEVAAWQRWAAARTR